MRLLWVFFRHELAMQLRAARFHGITLAYLVVTAGAAVATYVVSRRSTALVGPPMYAAMLDMVQPLATTLFGAALAVDIVARERDENSLAVVAMAPVSSTGYVLRRWLAIVAILLPITFVPRAVAVALASQSQHSLRGLAPILLGWLLHVAPLLIVVTALLTALGTITSRTVLALLLTLGIFTIGLGITNDLLSFLHRQIAGPGDFFGFGEGGIIHLMRMRNDARVPTATGYPLARELEMLIVQGALAIGITVFFLGISCAYLRRTKRDLRPWHIREDHKLRSFLRMFNRIREELSPDGGLEIPERIAIAFALIVPVAVIVMLTRRYDAFERLAAEQYAAETAGVEPMPLTIVPPNASLRGRVTSSGVYDATAMITLRNDGTAPQRILAFALNRGVAIRRVAASRGNARVQRNWERVGVVLDPPLAPRETRSFTFELHGTPGTYVFELPGAKSFAASWRRYRDAKESFDLADLSRSYLARDASAEQLQLAGPRLLPVPRYSPWSVPTHEWWDDSPQDSFVPEAIRPPTALAVDLVLPEAFTGVDPCGTASRGKVSSRCTVPIASYEVLATRFETMTLPGGIRLAYLPPHVDLARRHGLALTDAIALAKSSWSTFAMQPHAIFVERPAFPGERYLGDWRASEAMRMFTSVGSLNPLPEPMFIRFKPLARSAIATALIGENLTRRRPVRVGQQSFFRGFCQTIATWRTGSRKPTAVEPTLGAKPLVDPILEEGDGGWRGPIRLARVLVDIEYRVGRDRLAEGIEDFVSGGPARGDAKELLDAIGRRGGVSLDRIYTDYFVGRALPRLTLTDVTFQHGEKGWEVRGNLKNEGDGEVFCPVVLRTSVGSVRTTLRVDSKASTPFVLHASEVPRAVQLDPDRVVYRHAAVGLVDTVDYKEGS